MRTIIPDASIILKWSLEKEQEPDFPKAFSLLEQFLEGKIRILLPTLWRYEVGNILGLKQPSQAKAIMQALFDYQFDEVSLDQDYCFRVLDFLKELKNISFYDACYHALAIQKNGICITADHLYYRHATKRGSLVLLSDWQA